MKLIFIKNLFEEVDYDFFGGISAEFDFSSKKEIINILTWLPDVTIKDYCEYCGKYSDKKSDLRPYGFNGKLICFHCGFKTKNIKRSFEMISKRIFFMCVDVQQLN